MAEFIEVRATVEGHERAAALARGIFSAGLAASIDIAEVTSPRGDTTVWELTLITTDGQVPTLERRIRETADGCSVTRRPITHDDDAYPDWL
ncbi:hypothetical protein [Nonomuraea jabiensis]|uniref:Uncharacterized protein involved in tolerance to divalent cations n=1 Tax=Nonomuraea jabiensis TaxID=882448 RepID=A0A7W9FYE2_9ACTN|nr:hypothetical protein [Nonomuraea jabiensis]MBB5773821.1 uncharacterized protein involved in tolerance to divalent cations [Nonomuraea jabiensis]